MYNTFASSGLLAGRNVSAPIGFAPAGDPQLIRVSCQARSCGATLQVEVPASYLAGTGEVLVKCGQCSKLLKVQLPTSYLREGPPATVLPGATGPHTPLTTPPPPLQMVPTPGSTTTIEQTCYISVPYHRQPQNGATLNTATAACNGPANAAHVRSRSQLLQLSRQQQQQQSQEAWLPPLQEEAALRQQHQLARLDRLAGGNGALNANSVLRPVQSPEDPRESPAPPPSAARVLQITAAAVECKVAGSGSWSDDPPVVGGSAAVAPSRPPSCTLGATDSGGCEIRPVRASTLPATSSTQGAQLAPRLSYQEVLNQATSATRRAADQPEETINPYRQLALQVAIGNRLSSNLDHQHFHPHTRSNNHHKRVLDYSPYIPAASDQLKRPRLAKQCQPEVFGQAAAGWGGTEEHALMEQGHWHQQAAIGATVGGLQQQLQPHEHGSGPVNAAVSALQRAAVPMTSMTQAATGTTAGSMQGQQTRQPAPAGLPEPPAPAEAASTEGCSASQQGCSPHGAGSSSGCGSTEGGGCRGAVKAVPGETVRILKHIMLPAAAASAPTANLEAAAAARIAANTAARASPPAAATPTINACMLMPPPAPVRMASGAVQAQALPGSKGSCHAGNTSTVAGSPAPTAAACHEHGGCPDGAAGHVLGTMGAAAAAADCLQPGACCSLHDPPAVPIAGDIWAASSSNLSFTHMLQDALAAAPDRTHSAPAHIGQMGLIPQAAVWISSMSAPGSSVATVPAAQNSNMTGLVGLQEEQQQQFLLHQPQHQHQHQQLVWHQQRRDAHFASVLANAQAGSLPRSLSAAMRLSEQLQCSKGPRFAPPNSPAGWQSLSPPLSHNHPAGNAPHHQQQQQPPPKASSVAPEALVPAEQLRSWGSGAEDTPVTRPHSAMAALASGEQQPVWLANDGRPCSHPTSISAPLGSGGYSTSLGYPSPPLSQSLEGAWHRSQQQQLFEHSSHNPVHRQQLQSPLQQPRSTGHVAAIPGLGGPPNFQHSPPAAVDGRSSAITRTEQQCVDAAAAGTQQQQHGSGGVDAPLQMPSTSSVLSAATWQANSPLSPAASTAAAAYAASDAGCLMLRRYNSAPVTTSVPFRQSSIPPVGHAVTTDGPRRRESVPQHI